MKRPELLVFDVDGLLLNTEFLWQKAWIDTSEEYNQPMFSGLFNRVVGISGKDVENLLAREMPDTADYKHLLNEARIKGEAYIKESVTTMPGVMELLNTADRLGIRKAIATTTKSNPTEERLRKLNLFDRFDVIVCGDEVKRRKPDPEIYNTVLIRTGMDASSALVLEDTGYGVSAAYAANIKVIMVPSINQPTPEEREKAFQVVSSLFQVNEILQGE